MLKHFIFALCISLYFSYIPKIVHSGEILSDGVASHYVERFNDLDEEDVVNFIPNKDALVWILDNVPLFECPATAVEETYYYRWWTFRKQIKQTPHGLVLNEFILPVSHAGPFNTISCAFGHQISEGRWMRSQQLIDEYTMFWFTSGDNGGPAKHFHRFSSWAATALYDRYLVTGNKDFLINLLDELVLDYKTWESERQTEDGLFWQHDVKDGMEESISGGRRVKNIRPTINSYMAANALAISKIATLANKVDLSHEFQGKYESLRSKTLDYLWDDEATFFKVRLQNGEFSSAREAIGFIPWTFQLAESKHSAAWKQLNDPAGFKAPKGLTTAERRHPEFRTRGVGTCEWDGAVWPFATSQTLTGLANVLRNYNQEFVTKRDFFEHMLTYAQSHRQDGKPYIGEYHDEITGKWLITGKKALRSRFYNHSTFNDLVIGGLIGIVPREDNTIEIEPLIPDDSWDWFCLEDVNYHGKRLTILWDKTGDRYQKGKGLMILVDGDKVAHSDTLQKLTATLAK